MAITIIILGAVVIGLLYRDLTQRRKFDNVYSQLLDAETERLAKQSALYDCEEKAKGYVKQYNLQNQSRDELAKKHNSCKCEMETVVAYLDKLVGRRSHIIQSDELKASVEKIKSILEV
jgi:hypothetical protein